MQIGTIEAKYKEKILTIYTVIIKPIPAHDPPPNPFSKRQPSIGGHIVKHQDDFLDLIHPLHESAHGFAPPWVHLRSQVRAEEGQGIPNEATILVLDGKRCTISAQYANCIVGCFPGNEADRRIATR